MLTIYPWPGNVRELANAIERALVVCRGDMIEIEHLPIAAHLPATDGTAGRDEVSIAAVEHRHIERVLDQTGFNISRSARLLGIDRATLYNKIRKYGIERRR